MTTKICSDCEFVRKSGYPDMVCCGYWSDRKFSGADYESEMCNSFSENTEIYDGFGYLRQRPDHVCPEGMVCLVDSHVLRRECIILDGNNTCNKFEKRKVPYEKL